MNNTEARLNHGATHFLPMKNGVTPSLYYKKVPLGYSDGTYMIRWHYLSFCNIWMGSAEEAKELESKLKPIIKKE